MGFKLIFFLFAGLGCALWVFTSSNQTRALMILTGLFYIFQVGWIFYEYTGILLVDLTVFALLGLALANGQSVRFFFKEITPSFLFLMIWMVVASAKAPEPGWGIAEISKWVRAYLIFVCMANFIKNEKDLRIVMFAILAGFAFEALVGLYQWRRGNAGFYFLGERTWRPEWWRAYGTFYVPSYFSNYLIVIMPIVLRLLIFYKPPKRSETYYYGFLMVIGMAVLYATYSRGPWLSFLTVVVLMLLFTFFKSKMRPKVKWPIALGIVFMSAFLWKYLPVILDQFGEQRKTAAMSRVYLGQVALRVLKDNLIFGVGPANYELASPRYVVPIKEYPTEHLSERVHNSYLLIGAENGVPGLVGFVLLLGQMSWIYLRMFRSTHRLHLNLAIGGVMGLWALCTSFAASPDIHNESTLNQIFIICGLVFAADLTERRYRTALRQEQLRQRREAVLAQQRMQGGVNVNPPATGQAVPPAELRPSPVAVNLDLDRNSRATRRRP